jgi:glyoxylase-like metal-dependent hydrolase (beta-lactamase superfamily II)
VVLFDAYIHKGEEQRNYVPAMTADLIALRPEAIILGHGHYDHGQLAGPIAAATGATVVGPPRHSDQANADAGQRLRCLVAF